MLISAHGLEKSYANRILFEDMSFGIDVKERIGLVGPNGAGKSTLLKILAGQVQPDAGKLAKKRGLRLAFLDQVPEFKPKQTLFEALLEKAEDPIESQAKAWELMAHLDLVNFGEDHLVSDLSGGWKKRVALARELLLEPELLILDEPTNHLDLSGVLWLENYLQSAPLSLLMVTHDRLFLQRVTNRILDLDPRNPHYLLSVKGDYAQYLETKELEIAAQHRQVQVQGNRFRRETEWLRRGAQARQTKQQARIEAAADLGESLQALKAKTQKKTVNIKFGESDHAPKKLIKANSISKSYGDRTLFTDLDLLLTGKTRLGLLGDNGTGKSTLIRVLLGHEPPDSGTIEQADALQVAYFEQSRETLDFSKSVLENLCPEGDYVYFQGSSIHIRSYLDRFHFSGPKAELIAGKLSGGEQARLRIAQLMLKRSQVLVLDEPTNDLDMETLDSLSDAIDQFEGAVILVTHDRYFLDSVATQILAFPAANSGESLQTYASYFQWENRLRQDAPKGKEPTAGKASTAKTSRLSFNEKFELENMEAKILALETEIKSLNQQSALPETLNDHAKLQTVMKKMADIQAQIDRCYERWTILDAKRGGN